MASSTEGATSTDVVINLIFVVETSRVLQLLEPQSNASGVH